MTRAWEPGEVAMVTGEFKSGAHVPSAAVRHAGDDPGWHSLVGLAWCGDSDVITARPLVVIDPEDREQAERLAQSFACHSGVREGFRVQADEITNMQDTLREFADPMPPACTDEPKDLAARIVDRDGDIWARSGKRWGCLTTQSKPQDWQDLINVCGPLHEVTP